MSVEAKYIELVLENVESICIDLKNVEYICLEGIRDYEPDYKNSACCKYCRSIKLCINKKANKKYPSFLDEISDLKVFDRLKEYNDIVCIEYLDNEKNILKTMYVPWDVDDDCYENWTNPNMETNINENGDLEIIIEEKDKN